VTGIGLSSRDLRVLIAGTVVIAALLTASRGLPAWRAWLTERRASAAEMTGELARLEAAIPLQRALKDSLRARRIRLSELSGALVPGGTPPASAAALASLLSSAAARAGVRLGAVQLRPDSAGKTAFTRVAVRADATGDIRGITRLLAALEGGQTLLSVREFSVSSPSPAGPDTQAEALRVEMVVEGLAKSEGGGRREAGGKNSPIGQDSRLRGSDAAPERK